MTIKEITIKVKQCTCDICGKEWITKKEKPLSCPKCKRYDWDKKQENKP